MSLSEDLLGHGDLCIDLRPLHWSSTWLVAGTVAAGGRVEGCADELAPAPQLKRMIFAESPGRRLADHRHRAAGPTGRSAPLRGVATAPLVRGWSSPTSDVAARPSEPRAGGHHAERRPDNAGAPDLSNGQEFNDIPSARGRPAQIAGGLSVDDLPAPSP
jgi:hypothetical protein